MERFQGFNGWLVSRCVVCLLAGVVVCSAPRQASAVLSIGIDFASGTAGITLPAITVAPGETIIATVELLDDGLPGGGSGMPIEVVGVDLDLGGILATTGLAPVIAGPFAGTTAGGTSFDSYSPTSIVGPGSALILSPTGVGAGLSTFGFGTPSGPFYPTSGVPSGSSIDLFSFSLVALSPGVAPVIPRGIAVGGETIFAGGFVPVSTPLLSGTVTVRTAAINGAIPEPATSVGVLMGVGSLGLILRRRPV